MEAAQQRSWYKKKRYIIPLGVLGLVVLGNLGGSPSTPVQNVQSAQSGIVQQAASVETVVAPAGTNAAVTQSSTIVESQQTTPAPDQSANAPAQNNTDTQLSNDNYYTNSSGNEVHSPAYAPSQPAGATAQCRDGTYSFSQHHSGTCSGHGGVAEWL